MLKIFAGLKGSGKTKNLIEMVNAAQKDTKGNVVCIEYGTKLIHEINNATRLINIATYGVDDWEKLYGFVCGILASNYDLTDLFIDSALKICAEDLPAFEKLVEELDLLTVKRETNVVITASMPEENATDVIKKYL